MRQPPYLFSQSFDKRSAVFAEPFFTVPVIGHHARDLSPEARRVVHFNAVAKLVNDYIIRDLGRREHEKTVEAEVPLRRAAPPARALAPHRYPAVIDADKRRKIFDPLRYRLERAPGKRAYLFVGKGRNLIPPARRSLTNRSISDVRIRRGARTTTERSRPTSTETVRLSLRIIFMP